MVIVINTLQYWIANSDINLFNMHVFNKENQSHVTCFKRDVEIHRFRVRVCTAKLPVCVAMNTGRLPLTLGKRLGYRVAW